MMRAAYLVMSICIGLLWAQYAAAQPVSIAADTQKTITALKGGWAVAYRDTRLGLVTGRAYFDPEIDYGTVTYQLPGGGGFTLEAKSITAKGSLVRVLWGKSAAQTPNEFEPIGKKVSTPNQNIRLELGDAAQTITLSAPPPLDGSITSELTYYPKTQSFSGHWGQRVDAVTALSSGAARSGVFTHGPQTQGGAVMTGEEMWVPPQPIIKDTFSIRNQFSMGELGAAYPYPYSSGAAPSKYLKTRYVFVYGKNLPHRRGEKISIQSQDKDVSYYLYALKSTYEGNTTFADPEMRDVGFERADLKAQGQNAPYEREAGDDFLILEANLKPGVKPGFKSLTINGVETAWLLRFGDHRATLGFARDLTLDLDDTLRAGLPPETEQTDIVYARERVILELRTQVEVPLDEFQIILSKNGKLLKFGDTRGITLRKQTKIGSPKVYRSNAIHLVAAGDEGLHPPGTMMIHVQSGDTLLAALDSAQVLNLANPLVSAKVIASPVEMLQAIQGPNAPGSRLWREAVLKAAQCADVDGIEAKTAAEISREEADSYTNVVISTLWRDVETILKTRIKIGEHAGTIMMRPVFLAMLDTAAAVYKAPLDDAAIGGLRRTLQSAITKGDHPLGAVLVTAPKGPDIPLSLTFYDDYLKETHGLKPKEIQAYQINAMRSARAVLLERIKESLKKAAETDECNVKDMLYLTGLGTQPIQRRTYAGLMKLNSIRDTFTDAQGSVVTKVRSEWVADRQARARVSNVPLYAKTLKEQETLSDDAWDKYFLTVSLLSLPIGIGAEALAIESIVYATAVLDAGDLLLNLVQESTKQYGEAVELDFARGASVVIGTSRLRQAEIDDSSGVMSYFKTLASVAQAANAAASLSSAARMQRSVTRANRAIKSINKGEAPALDAFDALKPGLKSDIYKAFVQAMRREQALGRKLLNADELKVLEFENALTSQGLGATAAELSIRPEWARGLSEPAWRRLDDMFSQPHVQKLVRANPAEMSRLLLDEDALQLLRLPQSDLTSFQRAVTRQKNRAPTRGPEFVRQAAPANGNPEGLFFQTRVADFDGYRVARTQVYAGQSATGTRYGEFIRGRTPDTTFDTGKDVLVFELAMANRMALPDELLASPGRFIPGSPQLDLSALRRQGRWDRRAGPRWVYDAKVPLRADGPGVPFVMFSNLRSVNELGFRYADPSLGGIMLKQVASANTTGQLHWLRYAYPGKSVDELFRYTLSFRYAENTAQQLGFRITDVKVSGAVPGEPGYAGAYATLEDMVMNGRWFDPGGARTAQEATAAQHAFLKAYSVPGQPHVPQSFNVYLKLEPL